MPEQKDGITVTDDGGAQAMGTLQVLTPEWVRGWLIVEQARAWAAGDAQRAHYCNAAMNGEPGELQAILNGRPSPGLAAGGARRGLEM